MNLSYVNRFIDEQIEDLTEKLEYFKEIKNLINQPKPEIKGSLTEEKLQKYFEDCVKLCAFERVKDLTNHEEYLEIIAKIFSVKE